ncbi:hypothetical protein ACMFMG_008241 [Clarireedia jacksonii]
MSRSAPLSGTGLGKETSSPNVRSSDSSRPTSVRPLGNFHGTTVTLGSIWRFKPAGVHEVQKRFSAVLRETYTQGRIRWLDDSHVFLLSSEDKDHLDILYQHLDRITREIYREVGVDGAQMDDYTTDEDSGSDDSDALEFRSRLIEKISNRAIHNDELSRGDIDDPFYPPEFANFVHRSFWTWHGLWLDDIISVDDVNSLMASTGSMIMVAVAEGKLYFGADNAASIEDAKSKLEVILKQKELHHTKLFHHIFYTENVDRSRFVVRVASTIKNYHIETILMESSQLYGLVENGVIVRACPYEVMMGDYIMFKMNKHVPAVPTSQTIGGMAPSKSWSGFVFKARVADNPERYFGDGYDAALKRQEDEEKVEEEKAALAAVTALRNTEDKRDIKAWAGIVSQEVTQESDPKNMPLVSSLARLDLATPDISRTSSSSTPLAQKQPVVQPPKPASSRQSPILSSRQEILTQEMTAALPPKPTYSRQLSSSIKSYEALAQMQPAIQSHRPAPSSQSPAPSDRLEALAQWQPAAPATKPRSLKQSPAQYSKIPREPAFKANTPPWSFLATPLGEENNHLKHVGEADDNFLIDFNSASGSDPGWPVVGASNLDLLRGLDNSRTSSSSRLSPHAEPFFPGETSASENSARQTNQPAEELLIDFSVETPSIPANTFPNPRIQETDDIKSRIFHQTMRQKASRAPTFPRSTVDPQPGFLRNIEAQFARLMTPVRGYSGQTTVQLEFGRILLGNLPKKVVSNDTNDTKFEEEHVTNYFLPPADARPGDGPELHFTKIVTLLEADTAFLLNLRSKQGDRLWLKEVTEWNVVYEFECQHVDSKVIFAIEVDSETFETRIKVRKDFGDIYVHGTTRNWDCRISAVGFSNENEIPNECPDQSKPNHAIQIPDHLFPFVEIYSLRIRKTKSYLSQDRHSKLHITEVDKSCGDMLKLKDKEINVYIFREEKKEQTKEETNWFEISITSVMMDDFLKENSHLQLGQESQWRLKDLVTNKVSERLIRPACEILTQMDGVGFYNNNGLRKKGKGGSKQESSAQDSLRQELPIRNVPNRDPISGIEW